MQRSEIIFGDLIQRYNAGERDFSGYEIRRPPAPERWSWDEGMFAGLDLSNIILRDASIRWINSYLGGVIFRGADLSNVFLYEGNYERTDFTGARLCGVRTAQSVFNYAIFNDADLTGASFNEDSLDCTRMSRTNLTDAKFRDSYFCRVNLTDAKFRKAQLRFSTFEKCKLIRTDFSEAEFVPHRDYRGVRFLNCVFEDATLPDEHTYTVQQTT